MSGKTASSPYPCVIVVGAGVIGLAIGWRLAQAGVAVTLYDKGAAGSGASHAAAGMLAACVEAEPREGSLLALGRASQALWPAFAAELEQATEIAIGLRCEGTIVAAFNDDDRARLQHHLAFQQSLGLPVTWLPAADVRRREPHLASTLVGALWSPEDHQVDNRRLAAALRAAACAAGATLHEHAPVERIAHDGKRTHGVMVAGTLQRADIVILAAGAWSRDVPLAPPVARLPVRPVKGQMLALRMDPAAPILRHVLRVPDTYLVPRHDGRLIVGATVEERGFDGDITAGGLLSLLDAAWRALPAIEELPVDETWVGFRPGSRDDTPILGPGPMDGLIYATGHYRNGILLTPITARVIADLVLHGAIDPLIGSLGAARFQARAAAE
ncbi:glycine oxidase ThiO [Vineibacter terrae]|uniref:Glycine oxidase ThiO n=1 Tax=Vineibacter terrae TaxID=2586908 RepID=A0A5C8PDV1_9HYPH|nr:glycine oxidase ThiO [Vineibacter terrae]TXL71315.1 glycine oxidase ThiO [Vineibacter terrae]